MTEAGQPALYRGPGALSALQIWRARPGIQSSDVRRAVVGLWDDLTERFPGLAPRCLVAVSVASLRGHPAHDELQAALEHARPFEDAGGAETFPDTQADVLVQVAATTTEERLGPLRLTTTRLGPIANLDSSLQGGKIGEGREPFGFLDGVRRPSDADVERAAIVQGGAARGCSWLLHQRWQQDLERFSRLRPPRRNDVFGVTSELDPIPDAAANAHVPLARSYDDDGDGHPRMIRRGFPYRQRSAEGLAFVAASSHPDTFGRALRAMAGAGGERDRLLAYAVSLEGGAYVAPPSSEWLSQ